MKITNELIAIFLLIIINFPLDFLTGSDGNLIFIVRIINLISMILVFLFVGFYVAKKKKTTTKDLIIAGLIAGLLLFVINFIHGIILNLVLYNMFDNIAMAILGLVIISFVMFVVNIVFGILFTFIGGKIKLKMNKRK